jgi:hypothetical protein
MSWFVRVRLEFERDDQQEEIDVIDVEFADEKEGNAVFDWRVLSAVVWCFV